MEKDWELIYTTDSTVKAELISTTLEKQDMHVVIMNKKDSTYLIGEIELYVLKFEAENALKLLKTIQL